MLKGSVLKLFKKDKIKVCSFSHNMDINPYNIYDDQSETMQLLFINF
jgi:hypothetical protein